MRRPRPTKRSIGRRCACARHRRRSTPVSLTESEPRSGGQPELRGRLVLQRVQPQRERPLRGRASTGRDLRPHVLRAARERHGVPAVAVVVGELGPPRGETLRRASSSSANWTRAERGTARRGGRRAPPRGGCARRRAPPRRPRSAPVTAPSGGTTSPGRTGGAGRPRQSRRSLAEVLLRLPLEQREPLRSRTAPSSSSATRNVGTAARPSARRARPWRARARPSAMWSACDGSPSSSP